MNPTSNQQSSAAATATPAEHTRWFVEEVEPHGGSLRGYLDRRFPWLRDVDDIVQEAFFRLWRRSRAKDQTSVKSPKAALFAIARNAALDLGRRRALAEIEPVAEIETLGIADEGKDVAEAVSSRQELEFLAEALRSLPRRCREVLTLTKMYGYSQKQVAERLGISEHTVRALVAKGMRRCASYLRHRGVRREGRP